MICRLIFGQQARYWPLGGRRIIKKQTLRRRRLGRLGPAVLGQELVELGLVLGEAQAVEEAQEIPLLLLEPAQGVGAVLVEGAVAARRFAPFAAEPPSRRLADALIVPAAMAAMLPATHPSAPYEKGQDRKAHRPEEDKAQDHQGDPGGLADLVQSRRDTQFLLLDVNVIYIHINGPGRCRLSSPAAKNRHGVGGGASRQMPRPRR